MARGKIAAGIALMAVSVAVWWWALVPSYPDFSGTWHHVDGDASMGAICIITADTVVIDGVVKPLLLDRTADGMVLLRLTPDQPALPLQRSEDQLLILGRQGGAYRRR